MKREQECGVSLYTGAETEASKKDKKTLYGPILAGKTCLVVCLYGVDGCIENPCVVSGFALVITVRSFGTTWWVKTQVQLEFLVHNLIIHFFFLRLHQPFVPEPPES